MMKEQKIAIQNFQMNSHPAANGPIFQNEVGTWTLGLKILNSEL